MPTKKQIQEAKTIRVFADVAYLYPTADKLPAKYSKIVLLFTKRNFVEGKRWVLESIRI